MIPALASSLLASSAKVQQDAHKLASATSRHDRTSLRIGARRAGPLQDLWALHLARNLLDGDDPAEALEWLATIPADGPTRARADTLSVRALLALGRKDEASAMARAAGDRVFASVEKDRHALEEAANLRRAGKHREADDRLLALAGEGRRNAQGREAVKILLRRYAQKSFLPRPAAPARLLAFAEVAFSHRKYTTAVDVAKRVATSTSISSKDEQARGWFLIGKVYQLRKNRWYAARCFGDAVRLADPERRTFLAEAYYRRGECFQAVKQPAKARAAFSRALEHGGPYAAATLWKLAHFEFRAGATGKAEGLLRRLVREHPESYFAPKALWKIATRRAAGEDHAATKDAYLEFLEVFPDHRLANSARMRAAEAAFRGKAVLTARKLWTEVLEGPTVPDLFSLFAAQRLAGRTTLTFADRRGPGWERFLARVPENVDTSPVWMSPDATMPEAARIRAEALRVAGLLEDLTADLEHWVTGKGTGGFPGRAALAWALHRTGKYRQSLGVQETFLATRAPLTEARRGVLLTGLYSRGFEALLTAAAERYDVAPGLALAIAREESHFDPALQSWSDARGLMQVLPSTGRWIAKMQGKPAPRNFYDAATSADLGAWYLRHLLDMHAERTEPELVSIASYNGGPGYMRRLLARIGDVSLLEMIDSIDRDETRYYVHKVTRSLLMYEALGERRRLRLARRAPASRPVPRGAALPGSAGVGELE